MPIDPILLKEAYPEPLAIRGLETVGGWIFESEDRAPVTATGEYDAVCLIKFPKKPAYWIFQEAPGRPDPSLLLPLVDPDAAPGTWAILLRELAEAIGLDVRGATGFGWARTAATNGPQQYWKLVIQYAVLFVPGITKPWLSWWPLDAAIDAETDPARALVLARILVRQRKQEQASTPAVPRDTLPREGEPTEK